MNAIQVTPDLEPLDCCCQILAKGAMRPNCQRQDPVKRHTMRVSEIWPAAVYAGYLRAPQNYSRTNYRLRSTQCGVSFAVGSSTTNSTHQVCYEATHPQVRRNLRRRRKQLDSDEHRRHDSAVRISPHSLQTAPGQICGSRDSCMPFRHQWEARISFSIPALDGDAGFRRQSLRAPLSHVP